MRSQTREDTKLLILPTHLVDRLKAIAARQGLSLSSFATDSLEQALRVDEMDASLSDAVDAYRLSEIQRGAGMVDVPRSSLNHLVEKLYNKKSDELKKVWSEAGRWYGEYLRAKLRPEEMLRFLEKELLVAWNLDEAEFKESETDVSIRWASFTMTKEFTEILLSYLSAVMDALGYREVERDSLRGMAILKYISIGNKVQN
jgi:hypothetical protein